ncbi:hypothetical protein BEP19_04700 [Ammoniphilus oxalaticus]|uniref:CarD-like/TRCF RNAP-interacting domain-containing protein n=1 Tax=Ammoniphilus oxalaticus TaxID=66863 RepID=A0A419SM29_9BACL|nr:CarD family transcriptional regulator [Ammoniphilus oxalaticus]RKD25121.1 hypothetical protein BEP19_04700 [Ammoniphilus oxalaticus]
MYKVGDKIFYPMHGAGVIESMEEKEILGEKQLYFIIKFPYREMQIMIPKEKISNLNIRPLVEPSIIDDVFNQFHEGETETIANPNHRYRNNMNKLKSGDIYEGSQVIRDLTRMSRERTLGTDDRAMLDQAQQLLISEVSLVNNIEQEDASELLTKVIEE